MIFSIFHRFSRTALIFPRENGNTEYSAQGFGAGFMDDVPVQKPAFFSILQELEGLKWNEAPTLQSSPAACGRQGADTLRKNAGYLPKGVACFPIPQKRRNAKGTPRCPHGKYIHNISSAFGSSTDWT